MITVTDLAKEKVLGVMKDEQRDGAGLRISVQDGGTSRVAYGLSFVAPDDVDPADTQIDAGAFKLHVAPDQVKFLEGATLDFVDGLEESGFKVEAPNAGAPKPEGPVAEKIQQVITDRINPAIASHGGFVDLVGYKDDIAYLRFGGGCQGCGGIKATLQNGVEGMIKEAVPECQGIMDVTDHASGKNPYYQP
ncbi:hypothetical protein ABI59_06495 [Acidobacteria bacterium Mor1]|nr:hypothetical protein ABI59_06495 [Acidobacteria bacterium Mor1]